MFILAAIAKFFGGIKSYMVYAAAVAAAVLIGYFKARQDGKNSVRLEQAKAKEKLQDKYDAIDNQNIDPTGSYERLKRMSGDKGSR